MLIVLFVLSGSAAYANQQSGLLGGLAISGYDPVGYFQGEALQGSKRYIATYEHMTYYFANEENMQVFLENKAAYAPSYGGHGAYQMAHQRVIAGNPRIWKIYRGKLYFFTTDDSKQLWLAKAENFRRSAQAHWIKFLGQTPKKMVPSKRKTTTDRAVIIGE